MKKLMPLRMAEAIVERYSGSLIPSLDGPSLLNAVALSFFSPQLSLAQAMKAADTIKEARRIVLSSQRANKAKKKRQTAKKTR